MPAEAATKTDVRIMEGVECEVLNAICTTGRYSTTTEERWKGDARGEEPAMLVVWTINLKGIYVLPSGFLSRSSDATSASATAKDHGIHGIDGLTVIKY